MKLAFTAALLGMLTLLVPSAFAQTGAQFTAIIAGEHPPDHTMEVPLDSRKANMQIYVKATASGFVCPQDNSKVSIQVILNAYKDEWAGASVNPDKATIKIPLGSPGTAPTSYEASDEILLEFVWGENHPLKNAKEEYTLTTKTTFVDTCVPGPVIKEGALTVKAAMPDTPEMNTSAPGVDCAVAPDLPECQTASPTAEANSPGFDVGAVLAAAAGLVVLARRRSA